MAFLAVLVSGTRQYKPERIYTNGPLIRDIYINRFSLLRHIPVKYRGILYRGLRIDSSGAVNLYLLMPLLVKQEHFSIHCSYCFHHYDTCKDTDLLFQVHRFKMSEAEGTGEMPSHFGSEKLNAIQKENISNLFGSESDDDSQVSDVFDVQSSKRRNAIDEEGLDLFGSDSDNEPSKNTTASANNNNSQLFGSDSEHEDEVNESQKILNHFSQASVIQQNTNEYTLYDHLIDDEKRKNLDIEFKSLPALNPKSFSQVLRLPHFISVKQFDTNTDLSLAHFHIIWRNVSGSGSKRQSNSRLLKWTDGTFSLLVGGDAFEASLIDTQKNFAYAVQVANASNDANTDTSNSLECYTLTEKRIILQSDGTGTAHAKLAKTIANKYSFNKTISNINEEEIKKNPEQLQNMQAKEEEKRLRQRKNQQEARSSLISHRRPSLSASYLNDDQDFDTTNVSGIRAMRNRINAGENSDSDEMKDFIVDDDEYEGEGAYDEEKASNSNESEELENNSDADESASIEGDSLKRKHKNSLASSKRFKRNVIDSDEDD